MWGRLWAAVRGEAAGNLMGLLACTAVSQACGLGIVLLAARHLGQAGLGMFLFALTVTGYLALFGAAGAGQVLIREVAKDRGGTDRHVTAYLLVTGGVALAVTALGGLVVALFGAGEERALWGWLLAGNVAGSVSLLPLFDAQHRQARAAAVAACVDAATVAACAWLAWAGALTVPLAGVLMAGKWVLIFAGQLAVYHWTVRPLRWEREGADVWLFAWSGVKLAAAFALLVVPLNGGVVLVRILRTPEETAVIGLATQVAAVYFLLCWQAIRVAQPHIAGPHGEEAWFVRRLVLGLGGVFVGGGVAVVGGAAVLLWRVLPLYWGAITPTVLLVLAAATASGGLVVAGYLLRQGRERLVVAGHVAGLGLYLTVGFWLTGVLGLGGVVVTSFAAAIVSTVGLTVALFAKRQTVIEVA